MKEKKLKRKKDKEMNKIISFIMVKLYVRKLTTNDKNKNVMKMWRVFSLKVLKIIVHTANWRVFINSQYNL